MIAMNQALAALPLDFDRYEERAEILAQVHQYVDGTFTIFPEPKKEPDLNSIPAGSFPCLTLWIAVNQWNR